ncbi:Thivi_2564 family membrane protein [Legionella impletisoli]|uniref:Transmembrane protein n=1 Tax=Legionella impletisoli TaxID=343510 RepID=A0A917NB09_9GAMM|nr:Thivi_2564 family membrane protein [Legionella impletisoli]GGI79485.1 hypothetical protein GCM10007966_04980 [Legionella impletisoli]
MIELLNLFLLIIIVGVVLWLINAFIPMAAGFKTILNLLALILIILYILQFFGLIQPIFPTIHFIR